MSLNKGGLFVCGSAGEQGGAEVGGFKGLLIGGKPRMRAATSCVRSPSKGVLSIDSRISPGLIRENAGPFEKTRPTMKAPVCLSRLNIKGLNTKGNTPALFTQSNNSLDSYSDSNEILSTIDALV